VIARYDVAELGAAKGLSEQYYALTAAQPSRITAIDDLLLSFAPGLIDRPGMPA
jgi:hypothetical protein